MDGLLSVLHHHNFDSMKKRQTIVNIDAVSSIRKQIYKVNTEEQSDVIVQLPPPPAPWVHPITTVITTLSQYYGHIFGRQASRDCLSGSSFIDSFTVNGCTINSSVFEYNGKSISLLLCQMIKLFISLVGRPTVIIIKKRKYNRHNYIHSSFSYHQVNGRFSP